MDKTPKALRLQIAIFGRTNVGKSSFLNMLAGQDVAMISPVPGTTTDVVEKSIELLPIGPVTFLDTAGIDDTSILAEQRIERTRKIFDRAEVAVIIAEPNIWNEFEEEIVEEADKRRLPYIIAINKIDLEQPAKDFIEKLKKTSQNIFTCSCRNGIDREPYIKDFKKILLKILPDEYIHPMPLIGDLVKPGGIAVFIVPIDLQAPKGRLILPQVQSIRDILDNDAISVVVKEREYAHLLKSLNQPPDLVVCDSQVVMKMVADTPEDIKCTTFSILFSRYKGDIVEEAGGAAAIGKLKPGDKVLIAEACSHHPLEDDIGRVKIPRWLRQYLGIVLKIDHCAGRDFPENLKDYQLVIHCGSCMLTRHEKLDRIEKCKVAGVPITNYGIAISLLQGVLKRVLTPFPAALERFISISQRK